MNLGGGDESDWVDEDEDIAFAGGLGQFSGAASAAAAASSNVSTSTPTIPNKPEAYVLSAPPKAKTTVRPTPGGIGTGKRGAKGPGGVQGGRVSPVQEGAHEPVEVRTSLTTRRAPVGRVTSSYRAPAIQEEDEEEEEE